MEMSHRRVHMENHSMEKSLQDFLECTRDDAEDSLYVMGSGNYTGRCTTVPSNTHTIDMLLNYMVLVGCTSMILLLVLLLISSGIKNIGEGRYLYWTRSMAKKPCYKFMSRLLLLEVGLMLARHIYSIYQEASKGEFRQAELFLELYITQIALLAISAVGLLQKEDPPFKEHADMFQELQFKRGWSQVFTETNAEFTNSLVTALYKAKSGFSKDLLDMIDGDGCSSITDVLQACEPHVQEPEDDEDDSDEDTKDSHDASFTLVPTHSRP